MDKKVLGATPEGVKEDSEKFFNSWRGSWLPVSGLLDSTTITELSPKLQNRERYYTQKGGGSEKFRETVMVWKHDSALNRAPGHAK